MDGDKGLKLMQISVLFLFARFVLIATLPIEGLKAYGDFWNFFALAGLGRPMIDFWVEFPPVFPWLSRWIYLLVGGREHSYIYAFLIIFSAVQAISIFLVGRIGRQFLEEDHAVGTSIAFGFLTLPLFYTWAYFDSLAVFCLLWALHLLIEKKEAPAGIVLGVGALVKWFPLLLIPAAWKWLGGKRAIRLLVSSIFVLAMIWGFLYVLSPDLTMASMLSQGAKGSWESIWALIDGNLGTGNFGPDIDRFNPISAANPAGKPAVIPAWLTLGIFGGIGYVLFLSAELKKPENVISFAGLTMMIFFIWSPGYSPQWVLYLVPFVLWISERRQGILVAMLLILVSLLEWPIILSRGWFHLLEEVVILRTGVFILVAIIFYQALPGRRNSIKEVDLD